MLGEVEEQGFSVCTGGEGECAGIFGAKGIARVEGGAVSGDATFDELEPNAASGLDFVCEALPGREAHAVDVGILMNGGAAIAAIRGDDEDFGRVFLLGVGMPFGVAGL